MRYAGSPLCYHFDELRQAEKGPLLVELGEKGEPVKIRLQHTPPLHPMRELRGAYEELRAAELQHPRTGEYLRLVLTDRRLSPETCAFFEELARSRGSILMDRSSEYDPFRGEVTAPSTGAVREKRVEELFCDFYAERSGGTPPTEQDQALLAFAGELLQNADPHGVPTGQEIEKLLDYLTEQEVRP